MLVSVKVFHVDGGNFILYFELSFICYVDFDFNFDSCTLDVLLIIIPYVALDICLYNIKNDLFESYDISRS
jgi:hypothetical protein